jgi:phosphatidylglycerophosphate synthase
MQMSPVPLRLPEMPLRANAFASATLAMVAVVAFALLLQAVASLGPMYPAKAAGALAAGLLVVLAGLHGHHPFSRFGLANQVTLARAVLLALLLALVGESTMTSTAVVIVVLASLAIVLDSIDGRLARRYGTASAFGARFDMEVDALLVLLLALLAWQFGKAGAWVLLSGLLRYGFVIFSLAVPCLRQSLPLSRRRQTVCVIQLIGLTLALAPFIRPPVSSGLAAVALLMLVVSFLLDVRWLVRHAPG